MQNLREGGGGGGGKKVALYGLYEGSEWADFT